MEIPKDLNNEIWEYCRINNITNIDEFTLKLLKQGFTSEKFGATPVTKTVEKVVEKIVEVPVEKIVEVQVNSKLDSISLDLLNEVEELKSKNRELEELLEIERNKKNKDIYGE